MKKNKLILSFYIGVIALSVASVSMSVAWYAASRNLFVNSIIINIDADRELDISTSRDEGYVQHIDHTELDPTGVFLPITSAHSSNWTSQKLDSPIFYDESTPHELEDAKLYEAVDHGYFSQKFYLLADDDLFITIDSDPEKTYIKANEEYNKSYALRLYNHYQDIGDEHYKDYSVDELEERLNRIVKAMRYSILIKDGEEYSYTIIDPHLEGETYLGGLLDNDIDRYYDYYRKQNTNEFYERVYGEVIGTSSQYVYDDGLDEDSAYFDLSEAPNAFNARHKKGIKRFNLEKSIEKGLEIKKENAIALADFAKPDKPFRFPVYADTPKEVTVSIYIEGWDKDSVNYTMGAAFISNLTFKIDREM